MFLSVCQFLYMRLIIYFVKLSTTLLTICNWYTFILEFLQGRPDFHLQGKCFNKCTFSFHSFFSLFIFFPIGKKKKKKKLRNPEWIHSLHLKAEHCISMFWLDGTSQKKNNNHTNKEPTKNKSIQTSQLMFVPRSCSSFRLLYIKVFIWLRGSSGQWTTFAFYCKLL